MSLPRVYAAINAITAAFAHHGVAKERINLDDGYAYRGVDEVTERLAPLLAAHKLCILPRVLTRTQRERIDPVGESLVHVVLQVAFDLVSVEDGSMHTIEAVGEALDHSDKASAKAMTSAYKHAVLHAFCIPVNGRDDTDRSSPGRHSTAALPAPVQGWLQWAEDIAAVVTACATPRGNRAPAEQQPRPALRVRARTTRCLHPGRARHRGPAQGARGAGGGRGDHGQGWQATRCSNLAVKSKNPPSGRSGRGRPR